jgi:hypothetical protein
MSKWIQMRSEIARKKGTVQGRMGHREWGQGLNNGTRGGSHKARQH